MAKDEARSTQNNDLPRMPEQVQRDAIKNFPLALVITDPSLEDNPIIYVNSAFEAMTGYAATAALGKNCRFLQGHKRDQEAVSVLRDAISRGEEVTVDITNFRANGEEFINRLMVAPLRDDDGEVMYFLGVQTENTHARTHEEKAAELDERLQEVQHRIKNHLSMILSLVRMEARQSDGPNSAIDILTSRVEALSLLYEQVSDPATEDNDKRIALGAYLTRVCSTIQLLSKNATVRVNIHSDEAGATLHDASLYGLWLSEVLTNALRHAFDGQEEGEIDFSLTDEGERYRIEVNDNGHGLGDSGWPSEDSLGGKIVIDLVDRLNGDLQVDSSEDGTKITLVTPAV